MMQKKLAIALSFSLLSFLIVGCPHSSPPSVSPSTPAPSSIPAQSNAIVLQSGKALEGGTLQVHFKIGDSDALGVSASLMGPTLGYGNAGGTSGISFTPLAPGKYRLLCYAPSFATVKVEGIPIAIDPTTGNYDALKKAADAVVTLVPAAHLEGRVSDQGGTPLAGARISCGAATTLSKSDGTFLLDGVTPGKVSVRASKTRFTSNSSPAVDAVAGKTTSAGNISLGPTAAKFALLNPNDVLNPNDPLENKTIREVFSGLLSRLAQNGFIEGSQSESSIWLLVDPSSLSEAKKAEINAFVQSGGKLIVLGEWGGYSGSRPDAANDLLGAFGLNFQADLVRSTSNVGRPEWLNVQNFSFVPLVRPVAAINLFAGCSVFSVSPGMTIASTGAGGYRVQSTSDGIPVAAAIQEGDGLCIAVGDASAWTNFTASNGTTTNLERANNADFMLNLFQW